MFIKLTIKNNVTRLFKAGKYKELELYINLLTEEQAEYARSILYT